MSPEGVLADDAPAVSVPDTPAAVRFGVASGNPGASSVPYVSAEVVLNGFERQIIGSFTEGGLTFALVSDGFVELVSASPGSLKEEGVLVVPPSVTYEDTVYDVVAIGSYAFYLSGVASVELPASVIDVDERAFRSSDVSSIEVAEGNPSYASFDGILYDADLTRLLLIPGGRTGAARISDKAEEVDAAAFSHCAGVTAISVDAGSDHLSSWDGLLYDISGTVLMRVPAGATDITIRDGCTSIAPGALGGCSKLSSIMAPESVTAVSPYVFEQPLDAVALPASTLAGLESSDNREDIIQHSSIVALTASDDDVPVVSPTAIEVLLPLGVDVAIWNRAGFENIVHVEGDRPDGQVALPLAAFSEGTLPPEEEAPSPVSSLQSASTYAAIYTVTLDWNDATTAGAPSYLYTDGRGAGDGWFTNTGLTAKIRQLTTLPTKTGYTFNGLSGYSWATGAETGYINAKGEITAGDGNVQGNLRLTTHWTPNIYTVKLNDNEGSGGSGTIYLKYGTGWYSNAAGTTNITSVAVPTRAGYTFSGYKGTDKNGAEYTYVDSKGNLKNTSSWWSDFLANTTLTAQWTKNAISTVNLYQNAGNTTTLYKTIYLWYGKGWYGTSSPEGTSTALTTIGTPTRAGYTYKGFSTSSTATVGSYWTSATSFPSNTSSTFGSATTAKTTNLYAVWAGKTCTIQFSANGGRFDTSTVSPITMTATYGSPMPTGGVPIPNIKPTATGTWAFAGYFDGTSRDAIQYYTASGASAHNWDKNTTTTRTLYAHWYKTVTLDRQGGSGGTSSLSYYYSAGFKADSITKPTTGPDGKAISSSAWIFLGYCGVRPTLGMSEYPNCYFDGIGARTTLAYSDNGISTVYAWWVKEIALNKYATSATAGATTKIWALKGAPLGYQCSSTRDYDAAIKEKFPASSPLKVTGWAPVWTSSNAYSWAFDGYWTSGGSTSATQYINKGGNGIISCPADMPSTLYAQWSRAIPLEKNGGSGGSDSAMQVYNASGSGYWAYRSVAPPTVAPAGGWAFLCYSSTNPVAGLSNGNGYQYFESNGMPTGRTTTSSSGFYAWWVKELELDKNASDANDGNVTKIWALKGAPLGYVCTSSSAYEEEMKERFPNPSGLGAAGWAPTRTKAGFVCSGFYDSASGAICYITKTGEGRTAVPSNIGSKIYAHWAYAAWKITLDGQGATTKGTEAVYVRQPPNNDNKYYSDEECTQRITYITRPTKTGYIYLRHSPTPMGTDTFINGSGQLVAGTGNYAGDTTLYARWRGENVWIITLNDDGADKVGQPRTLYWNSTVNPPVFTDMDCTARFVNLRELPEKRGYTFAGYYGVADIDGATRCFIGPAGTQLGWGSRNITNDGVWTAHWNPIVFAIKLNPNGEDVNAPESISVEYESDTVLPSATRPGYIFMGWDTQQDGRGVRYRPGDACGTFADEADATVTLYAQWEPRISADIPFDVTARVDLLGIEEQQEAAGYIESHCGNPLKVASIKFASLSGATELFGAGNESQVQLQVFVGEDAGWQPNGANANFSFPLGASATESDAGKLAALTMQAYKDRVPISYRFDIPDALLPSLAETTKPVCSVAYTVALA